jgi:hypothetical protein
VWHSFFILEDLKIYTVGIPEEGGKALPLRPLAPLPPTKLLHVIIY